MPKSVWNSGYYVRVYELAKGGLSDAKISKALGIAEATFRKWRRRKKYFREAIKLGRQTGKSKPVSDFLDYVYKQLPKRLQKLWAKVDAVFDPESEDAGTNAFERIEALFEGQHIRVRQHLFIHAYVSKNFNASEACRSVNVSYNTYRKWLREDADFRELVDEVLWHMRNFYQGSLNKLVAWGDSPATIYAAKAMLGDRGYSEKLEVKHSGQVDHRVAIVHLSDAIVGKLSLECRTELLAAIDAEKPPQAALEVD